MNYTEYYYARAFGCLPGLIGGEYSQTEKTVKYLLDNGFSAAEICSILDEIGDKPHPPASITPADLPDKLWTDSLIERGEFYYHRVLQITSPAPVINLAKNSAVSEPYFLEMRIRFTLKHLMEYFVRRSRIDEVLIDETRDAGSLRYLLKKYAKISIVRPLDFVLMLIDAASADERPLNNILDVQNYEATVLETVKKMTAEAAIHGGGMIVWR